MTSIDHMICLPACLLYTPRPHSCHVICGDPLNNGKETALLDLVCFPCARRWMCTRATTFSQSMGGPFVKTPTVLGVLHLQRAAHLWETEWILQLLQVIGLVLLASNKRQQKFDPRWECFSILPCQSTSILTHAVCVPLADKKVFKFSVAKHACKSHPEGSKLQRASIERRWRTSHRGCQS